MGPDRYNVKPGHLEATRLALREVAEVLDEFEGTVLVGGIVPYLLVPQEDEPHEGTVDIDVVVDPTGIRSEGEDNLGEILMRRNFQQDPVRPFRWTKSYDFEGQSYNVLLEILTGGTPSNILRTITREDVHASVITGMEIALVAPVNVQIDDLRLRVASMPAFFAMKSVALEKRDANKRGKDAADIVYCLRNYPGGPKAIAGEIQLQRGSPLIAETIDRLSRQFESVESLGPTSYAELADDPEEQNLRRQEAYARVQDLLEFLWNARS